MIEGRNIICIANRWDYDPTSKHQVMKRLARHNQIIWVNYRGSRAPQASLADATAVVSTLRAVLAGARQVSDSIVQVTPLVIPGARHPALRRASERLLVSQIRRVLAKLPPRPVQLWSFAPDVAALAGQFDEECLVYYCVDDFASFREFDRQSIEKAEQRLIDKADVVFATSQSLYETRRELHLQTHLIPHGVEVEHFASAVDRDLPVPADIADLPRPIYGFFGYIHYWFDTELIAAAARARPEASFVLLGDCPGEIPEFRELPNVHLLGRREYRDLPAYCSAFDAGLLPFRIDDMTRSINPIKLREYLAAGLPVVSTSLPEALPYRPEVLFGDDPERFCKQLDRALEITAPRNRRRRSARVAGESWDTVVENLSDLVSGITTGCPLPTQPTCLEAPFSVEPADLEPAESLYVESLI